MAITEAKRFQTIAGDKVFGCYRLKGDGSTKDWTAPLDAIEGAWFQRITDTATSELMTFSGAVISMNEAIDNNLYTDIFFVGT